MLEDLEYWHGVLIKFQQRIWSDTDVTCNPLLDGGKVKAKHGTIIGYPSSEGTEEDSGLFMIQGPSIALQLEKIIKVGLIFVHDQCIVNVWCTTSQMSAF